MSAQKAQSITFQHASFYDKQGWLGFILISDISVHFIVCACLRNFAHVPAFYILLW